MIRCLKRTRFKEGMALLRMSCSVKVKSQVRQLISNIISSDCEMFGKRLNRINLTYIEYKLEEE